MTGRLARKVTLIAGATGVDIVVDGGMKVW